MSSRLRLVTVAALGIGLLATAAGTLATHTIVRDQERRLLKERTAEVGLVLSGSINAIPATLDAQGGILGATGESTSAYERSAAASVAAGPGALTFAWLRRQSDGTYLVLASAGNGLHDGEVVSDSRTATFNRASHATSFVSTRVIGKTRQLGYAIGPPAAPAGTVLYRESMLGPEVSPPRAASTAPFNDVDVVVYGTPTVQPDQVLTSTDREIPLTGAVDNEPLAAGASNWLISVKARQPLVGSVAAESIWFVLGAGVLGSLLVAAIVETAARRRDTALALYASEHQMAETLQRSLLPELPAIAGLHLAARYLAAERGQEVGGDWFDAFEIAGGRVGITIGDVMGHDLAAASAMSQIRAGLRAYAVDGDAPAVVMNRLDHLVGTFGMTPLVTIVYGILEPADADGSRLLRFANAGHLPPLLRGPDGSVASLTDGGSVLIGTPMRPDHAEATYRLPAGSTLLMFTDGLVEVPSRPIEETLDELAAVVAGVDPHADVDALCSEVLAGASASRRDDIALLAVQVEVPPAATSRHDAHSGSATT